MFDDGVARIDFEIHPRGESAPSCSSLHHAAHMRRHEFVGVERDAGESTRRSLAFTSATRHQAFLQPFGEVLISASLSEPSVV